jgi:hypothetical protein
MRGERDAARERLRQRQRRREIEAARDASFVFLLQRRDVALVVAVIVVALARFRPRHRLHERVRVIAPRRVIHVMLQNLNVAELVEHDVSDVETAVANADTT